MTPPRLLPSLLLVLALAAPAVRAEEGMWTFDNFPSAKVEKAYGFSPDKAWLDHVRLSSVRLALGCSGSFVSPDGLVMTNHHCARRCIQDLSTPEQDLTAKGFYARTQADERTCPRMEINQLTTIKDVTAPVQAATRGLSGEAFNRAQKAEFSRLEKACQTSDQLRCEVVTLYRGGQYHLYTYRRWKKDVRLVFAPEEAIAFFGGDPDNFNFPRYDLDVSFLRVYEDGKPLQTPEYFRWSPAGAREGELTFVSGNPGSTGRLLTVAQLAALRDQFLPLRLERLAQLRGWVAQYQQRSPEARRTSQDELFGVENSYKGMFGRREALLDPVFFAAKVKEEQALRARVAKMPALQKDVGGAWDAIAQATATELKLERETTWIRSANKYYSELFGIARNLVWGAAERQKPDTERYREFTDARLPATELVIFNQGAHPLRAGGGALHPRPHQDARGARRRPSLREEGAGQGLSPPARDAGGAGHEALRRGAAPRALVRRGSRHRRLRGPDDRPGPPPGSGHARGPEGVRGPGRVGAEEERRADRPGTLPARGDEQLPGCDLHRPAVVRLGAGLDRGRRTQDRALHRVRRRIRARHRRAAVRPARARGSRRRTASPRPPRSTSSPPTTSSVATPARRW